MNDVALNPKAIFLEALERPSPEELGRYLDEVCGGDAVLRGRVEALLQANEQVGDFLGGRTQTNSAGPGPLLALPGDTIGPYKLLQQIGEGGMGMVYMADQESPVRRRVALKIIKPGMDSRQVIARFEAERQALAMMDHQNIARVLDAGTTDTGLPYFVMELVHGVPLTKFCDDNRLPLRQRLELFVPVCQAIQHAHQKGIIHRDIKPGNVLVTMYDDKPVPKVIDFGVAKAIEQRLTEKTLFTQYGTFVGTLEYMSPEQAEMNAFGVDTRSDVYSLGVLLYELLTGTTPIEKATLREAALVELVRIIREQEPPRPSIRLSTSVGLPKFAAACSVEPTQLTKLVRGELDWIVMKCLEKDRTRRYETVNGLARDVQRFLSHEPVEACPPSPFYRMRKLAWRHRGLLTTAILFAVLLLVGSLVSAGLATWAYRAQRFAQASLIKERQARQEAVAAAERADQAAQRLLSATKTASEGIEYSRRRNWSAAYERFTRAAEMEPEFVIPYVERGALFIELGLWDRAAADYAHRFRLAPDADAQTCFEHALLMLYTGDETAYRQACAEIVRQHGQSAEIGDRYVVARTRLLGIQPVGEPAELVRQTESLVDSAQAPWLVGLAGRAHLKAGDLERAVARSREAIELGYGAPSGIHRRSNLELASALALQGKRAEAEAALARATQARDQWLANMKNGFLAKVPGVSWWDWLEFDLCYREVRTQLEGAEPAEDERIGELYQRGLAAIAYGDAFTLMDEGRAHLRRRAWQASAESFAEVLDKLPADFRPSSQAMHFCVEMVDDSEVFSRLETLRANDSRLWNARARVLVGKRQWSEAANAMKKSRDLLSDSRQAKAPSDLTRVQAHSATTLELASLYLLAGDHDGHRDLCRRIIEESGPTYDAFSANCLSRACTLAAAAEIDPSVPLRLAEEAVGQQPKIAWHQFGLGIAHYRAGQNDAAEEALRDALTLRPDWLGRGQCQLVLALINCQRNRMAEARQWLNKARTARQELDRTMAGTRFGYATTEYMGDWLTMQILSAELEPILDGEDEL